MCFVFYRPVVKTKFHPKSRTQMIMGLIPPVDSGSSSSDDKEANIVFHRSKATTSCEKVTLPTNDILTTLSDIELDLIESDQTKDSQPETSPEAAEPCFENDSLSNIISDMDIDNDQSIHAIYEHCYLDLTELIPNM